MKWLTWRKSRISLFLPEDCIETESGLTTCGIKGTSTTAWMWTNSSIADSTKDALQWNLDCPDISINQNFSLVPIWSWIFISHDQGPWHSTSCQNNPYIERTQMLYNWILKTGLVLKLREIEARSLFRKRRQQNVAARKICVCWSNVFNIRHNFEGVGTVIRRE